MTNNRTAELVSALHHYRYDSVPESARASAKRALTDALGALMAATSSEYPVIDQLRSYVGMTEGRASSVFGTVDRTDPSTAALLNGTLAYYCDIESHHASANVHAIAVVAPAALAVAESEHSSGKELLAAVVGGIDVAARVSYALGPAEMYARGLHPSTIAGTVGAAVAAGLLLKLDDEQFLNALGLAGTSACGLLSWVDDPSEQSRPLNIGLASQAGTQAALLARHGFKGPDDILGGKYPFGLAFTGQWDQDALLAQIGERYEVEHLFFKRNSCCVFIPAGLDGLTAILREESIDPSQIDRVDVRSPQSSYHVVDNNPLRSHCMQYVLAVAAYRGAVTFADIMTDRRIEDSAVKSLSERVFVTGDSSFDVDAATEGQSVASVTTVTLRDGSTHTRDVPHPLGSPANPLSDDALREKFFVLTEPVLTPADADRLHRMLVEIEELDDVAALATLMGAESASR
ncbi:MmgE/PrpD family protein [Microbacterium sp. RD1]|uniref:MmgE/PrpD family protein n=1 Tax=Microbacterium sp. RD1 TaxID=3457313 RepID=UPI003FA607CB